MVVRFQRQLEIGQVFTARSVVSRNGVPFGWPRFAVFIVADRSGSQRWGRASPTPSPKSVAREGARLVVRNPTVAHGQCRQCDYSEGSHTSDRDSSVQTRPQSFRRVRRLRLGPLWRRRLGSRTAGGWAVCCCSSWWWCWPWWCWCWSREGAPDPRRRGGARGVCAPGRGSAGVVADVGRARGGGGNNRVESLQRMLHFRFSYPL